MTTPDIPSISCSTDTVHWPSVVEGVACEGHKKRKRSTSETSVAKRPREFDSEPPLPSLLPIASSPECTDKVDEFDLEDDLDFDFDPDALDTQTTTSSSHAPHDEEFNAPYFIDANRSFGLIDTQPAASSFISNPNNDDTLKSTTKLHDTTKTHNTVNASPSVDPPLCPEQQEVVDLIANGNNVFYTGSAGCGKSTVLKAAVKRLHNQSRMVHIVAPTGSAALQIGGKTTWSYMGWTPDCHKMPLKELEKAVFKKTIKKRLRQTDVLIIDEISMVENHHFERMNRCLKAARNWSGGPLDDVEAFGGVQVIVTGDFCQLPPVKPFEHCIDCGLQNKMSLDQTTYTCTECNTSYSDDDKWAFKSKAWAECKFIHFQLQEIHRQSDRDFVQMLQKCRLGFPFSRAEEETLLNHPCNVANATRLYSTRSEVNQVNGANFAKLVTPKITYRATDGHELLPEHDSLRRRDGGYLVALRDHKMEPVRELKQGMLVILQVNLDLGMGLCNGSQGIVCGFEVFEPKNLPKARPQDNAKALISGVGGYLIGGDYAKLKQEQIEVFASKQKHQEPLRWPRVLFHNGVKRTIYPECIVNTSGQGPKYSLLYRTQIPLMAGWAMSIHKSQGMTLDRVVVNLTKAFEEGQVYVALSRARGLPGLKVEGSSQGLAVGRGGNDEVQAFLRKKFPTIFGQRWNG